MLFANLEPWMHFRFQESGHHAGVTYIRLPGSTNAYVSQDGTDCAINLRPNRTWVTEVSSRTFEISGYRKLRWDNRAVVAYFNRTNCFNEAPLADLRVHFVRAAWLGSIFPDVRLRWAITKLTTMGVVNEGRHRSTGQALVRLTGEGFLYGWKEGALKCLPLAHS